MTRLVRPIVVCLLAVLAAGSLASCKAIDGMIAYGQIRKDMRKPASAPPARMDIVGGMPIVHLYGTSQDRGTQYGTLMRKQLGELHRCLDGLLDAPTKARMLAYADSQEESLPAEVREELMSMSDASGVPYMELVAINITPEFSCSGLAAWDARAGSSDTAGLIMGRNGDYFSLGFFKDRGMLVRVIHPHHGHAVAGVTFLGMIGSFTGMNARGVAYGNMMVSNASGPGRQNGGLTIQLALRQAAMRSGSAAEMGELLRAMKHVVPMNVMVADPNEALVLELAPGGRAVRRGDDGVLVATNHFLSPELRRREVADARFDSLLAAGRQHRDDMTVEQMKKALWDARRPESNLQATIFEPARMRMHVSINRMPATAGPYVALDLTKLFAEPPAKERRDGDGSDKDKPALTRK
jgi:predicted choloylglycine hydrolase